MRSRANLVAALCAAGLATGLALRVAGLHDLSDAVLVATASLVSIPLLWSVVRALVRRDVGVDAIALVAIGGALALHEYLVATVIALMMAGGNALEERATARARRELSSLVSRVPQTATVLRQGDPVEVAVGEVVVGDVVLVRAGEVLPVDGVVDSDAAVVDESALTGESLPAVYRRGQQLRSGSVAVDATRLRAVRPAAESAYARVVRLVQQAQEQRAPFVRLADRYAAAFLPLTALVAGVAWIVSGDPERALAVFVVATPCPLILAAPVALVSGVSRAARSGVVVKGAGVIERLGGARTVLLDKTGTVTLGEPQLAAVRALDGVAADEALRLAASLDQLSLHPYAASLVRAAHERELALTFPRDSNEYAGEGVCGDVDGRSVAVGSAALLRRLGYPPVGRVSAPAGQATAYVGIDGVLAAALDFTDPPRADALGLVERLHRLGIVHVAMLTGDHADVAARIGDQLGVDRVYAEQTPEDKLDVVAAVRARRDLQPVVMVGDGVNDAPALARADVGIAMGAQASAASETADAVILVDRIDRVVAAIATGRRSLAIARQSVVVGLALSLGAMGFAAVGLLTPLAGAILQEGIDVAVILNALRALRG